VRVARDLEAATGDPRLTLEKLERPLHGHRVQSPKPAAVRGSRNQRRSRVEVITIATLPIIVACTISRSALSAKKSMKTKMIPALTNSTIQSGSGITPSAP
jgi:hypothetical protein